MRILLIILSLFLSIVSTGQSYNLTFTPLTGVYSRPFAGPERWQGVTNDTVSGVGNPTGFYRRMSYADILTADSNVKNWTKIRTAALQAANLNQTLSLCFMTVTPFAEGSGFNATFNYNGAYSSYPIYVHQRMQAESPTDWIGSAGHWIPNYNSPYYHFWLRKENTHIHNFIDTATVFPTSGPHAGQTIQLKNMIGVLGIRGIGSYGEGHHYNSAPGNNIQNFPAGTFPTVASFKAIIDAHVDVWQNYHLVGMIALFDNQRLMNTWVPAEVGVYLLQQTTSKGPIGWRRDQWGANDSYLDFYLKDNPGQFGGYHMDTAIMNRYKYAPITGEPPGGPDFNFGGINLGAMAIQVRTYHPTWIGNGNYGGGFSVGGAWQDTMRLAFSLMGPHLRLKTNSNIVVTGGNMTVNMRWQNHGLTPAYDHWTVQYFLKNGAGTTVWTGNSTFDPYLFLPEYGEQTKTDNFSPGVVAGNYSLHMKIVDPLNYRQPYPLQITGRQSDGSYFLSNIVLGAGTPRPIVSAGANQSITLPDDDASLTGTASGGVAPLTYLWTADASNPAVATIGTPTALTTTVDNMTVAGVYRFILTVTDDDGTVMSDDMTVTVNTSPNIAPVASAVADPTEMTLPTDEAELDGSGSTDDTGITGYLWEQISGPATATFSSTTTAIITVSDLVPGIYTFRLTVTDAGALTDTDEVTVEVNNIPLPHGRYRWKYRFRNN